MFFPSENTRVSEKKIAHYSVRLTPDFRSEHTNFSTNTMQTKLERWQIVFSLRPGFKLPRKYEVIRFN